MHVIRKHRAALIRQLRACQFNLILCPTPSSSAAPTHRLTHTQEEAQTVLWTTYISIIRLCKTQNTWIAGVLWKLLLSHMALSSTDSTHTLRRYSFVFGRREENKCFPHKWNEMCSVSLRGHLVELMEVNNSFLMIIIYLTSKYHLHGGYKLHGKESLFCFLFLWVCSIHQSPNREEELVTDGIIFRLSRRGITPQCASI